MRLISSAAWRGCLAAVPTALAVWSLAGCDQPSPSHADWVIHAKLIFLAPHLAGERAPLPLGQFRLFCPYIAGDIYGEPTTGDFIAAAVDADYRLQIDLNRSRAALLASLQATQFSLPQLHIQPAEARVARLAPMVLQADGIEPLGRTNWVDGDSRRSLLLLYFDRPATISGRISAGGKPLLYAIHAKAAGYVWVAQEPGAAEDVYTVIPAPARLLLAVSPFADDFPKAPLPAQTE